MPLRVQEMHHRRNANLLTRELTDKQVAQAMTSQELMENLVQRVGASREIERLEREAQAKGQGPG